MRVRLTGFWSSRKCERGECAQYIADTLAILSRLHPSFASWYSKRNSRTVEPGQQVSHDDMGRICSEMTRNRTDTTGEVIEDLGFDFGVWNGLSASKACGLNISCGITARCANICNSINLEFPDDDLVTAKVEMEVLKGLSKIWQPQWMATYTLPAIEETDFDLQNPIFDRLLYVDRSFLELARKSTPKLSAPDSNGIFIFAND